MKKSFGLISFLVAVALSLSFASCSSSGSDDVTTTKDYTCKFFTTAGQLAITDPTDNRVDPWFFAKTEELNKTLGGTVTTKGEEEYNNLKNKCSDAVDAIAKEFNTAVKEKTHDFGYYDTSNLKIGINIYEKETIRYTYAAMVEYHNAENVRLNSKKRYTVDVTNNLSSAETYNHEITISLDDLEIAKNSDPEFNVSECRTFNCETYDIYKGSAFLSKVTHNKSARELTFTLSYQKAHAAEYPGKWYFLLPIKMYEHNYEAAVYIENK